MLRFGYGAGVAMPFVLIPLFMVTALLVIYRLRRGAWPPAGPAMGLLSFVALAAFAFFAVAAVGMEVVERLLLTGHYGLVAVAREGLSVARHARGSPPRYLLTNGDEITGDAAGRFELVTFVVMLTGLVVAASLAFWLVRHAPPLRRAVAAYGRYLKRCAGAIDRDEA